MIWPRRRQTITPLLYSSGLLFDFDIMIVMRHFSPSSLSLSDFTSQEFLSPSAFLFLFRIVLRLCSPLVRASIIFSREQDSQPSLFVRSRYSKESDISFTLLHFFLFPFNIKSNPQKNRPFLSYQKINKMKKIIFQKSKWIFQKSKWI